MNLILFLSAQSWVARLGWALVHFLWQGTLIAGVYALLRKRFINSRHAQARYLLACAALAVMAIVPVITFSSMGPSSSAPRVALAARTILVPGVAVPYDSSVPFASLPSEESFASSDEIVSFIVVTWFAGVVVLWVRLVGGWMFATRMQSRMVRAAPSEWKETFDQLRVRVRVSASVRLMTSALVSAPTVVGWLMPVILLPIGALSYLPPAQIEVLLIHELAHIRRHDYLVNLFQAFAEVLLFYHPAVWWISRHLRAERELCCDDVAIAMSGDRLTYACALARIESLRPEHLNPSLAANGGCLADRIARLLDQPRRATHDSPWPGTIITAVLLIAVCSLFGQAVDTRPAFEVASVKPDRSGTGVDRIQHSQGRLIIENVSLKRLIGMAHGVPEGREYLLSGPNWLDSENFDIAATFPPETANPGVLVMLQRLLEERFQLKLHRETKEFSAYALVVAKGGPKLHPAVRQGGAYKFSAQAGHAVASSLTMAQLADRLSRPAFQLDRQVVDYTGLTGTYDLTLDWRVETAQIENQTDTTDRPSIFSALTEQLGLSLERRKVALDVLVVDHANRAPTEN
jgi:uncharacterized protein (TIGR03435 family)